MKTNPLVSVFVPYYNDKDFLKICIESILAQSYENFELILLNHASTDSSRKIAHSYDDARIKHIDMQSNLGAGSGILMLEFLKIAKGEYIKLFCADDVMRPDCIEKLVGYMRANPQKDIVFADMQYVDKDGESLKTKWSLQRSNFSFGKSEAEALRLLFDGVGFIPYPSLLIKAETLKSANIDKSFVMMIDMSIWADLLIKGAKVSFIDEVVVNYRIHDKQTASSKHREIVYRRSFFESLKYCDFFYKIRSPKLLKAICPHSEYARKVREDESRAEIFEFVIAHHYLTCNNQTYVINGYQHMYELMQNDISRKLIDSEFGFGIKQMREIYSKPLPHQKAPKEIGLFGLLYLLLRRVWIIVTFKQLRHYFRDKRKFTE